MNDDRANPLNSETPPAGRRPPAGVVIALFAVSSALLFCARLFVNVRGDWTPIWHLALEVVFFGLPWALYYQFRPESRSFSRLSAAPKLRTCIAAAIAALVGLEYLAGLNTLWLALLLRLGVSLETIRGWMAISLDYNSVLTELLIAAAAPALFEELLYRGLLLPSLERYGIGRAAVISGALFALMHLSLPGLPAQLMIGVPLAMLALASDSLILPMIYHFTHNASAIIFNNLVRYGAADIQYETFSRETMLTASIQTAVSLVLWALLMRVVLLSALRGRGERLAGEESPDRIERIPRGITAVIILLILLMSAVYAWQFIALT